MGSRENAGRGFGDGSVDNYIEWFSYERVDGNGMAAIHFCEGKRA